MRVHIVCYEDLNGWILGKIATKLCDNLNAIGISCDISKKPDPSADINHHIIYFDYDGKRSSIDTVMITHINTVEALSKVYRQLKEGYLGICPSEATINKLTKAGVPREKLGYVLLAHDEVVKPRPLVIGLTSKVQGDGRKREEMLPELAKRISPAEFSFKIMGSGWGLIVHQLRDLGFEVEYHEAFDYEVNKKLVPSLDYYLYPGYDEGSMGFIDALAAGVPTIVTPQGFHLHAEGGLTHPFTTFDELVAVFEKIAAPKRALIKSVESWTWRGYAKKHAEMWRHLMDKDKPGYVRPAGEFTDGLSSIPINDKIADPEKIENEVLHVIEEATQAFRRHDFGAAEAVLTNCVERFPVCQTVRELLSQMYLNLGDEKKAIDTMFKLGLPTSEYWMNNY